MAAAQGKELKSQIDNKASRLWNHFQTVVGTGAINISSLTSAVASEIFIQVTTNDETNVVIFQFPRGIMTNTDRYMRGGGYESNSSGCYVIIKYSTSSISLTKHWINGTNVTANSKIAVLYRY